jgi:Type II secretion system (T2SS), protein E, N-terminal domain
MEAATDLPAALPLLLPAEPSRVPLGTLLVRDGLLTTEQLELALAEKEQTGRRVGEIVVAHGWVPATNLASLLAEQHGLEYLDLATAAVDPAAATLLPEKLARRYEALLRGASSAPRRKSSEPQSKARILARYWFELGRRELASL